MSQTVDLIIHASWILPIVPRGALYKDCSLVINAGRIVAIAPRRQAADNFTAKEHIELAEHLLMPGLINAHGHAAMSLLRGYADDLPLATWLEEHIWPAESQWVDETFVADGTQLAIAEMLKTGTTCFSDMYFFPEVAADCALQTGIRAQITFPILDFPTPWAQGPDQAISQGLALFDKFTAIGRITIGFGPHAPYTVSNEVFTRIATLSAELQAPVQVHLHETQHEVTSAINETSWRPIQRLNDLGMLTPRTQCVHMTALNADDIALAAQQGVSVIHCPESNLKLNSGLAPVQTLLDAGVTVALGTDGAASNNDLDLFGEMKTAALIGKITADNAAALNAESALEMATINGAKALGISDITGSLEAGKAADVIAIDLSGVEHLPRFNLASLLVYTQVSHKVSHVWVEGKCLMNNSKLTTINEPELKQRVSEWQTRIADKKSP